MEQISIIICYKYQASSPIMNLIYKILSGDPGQDNWSQTVWSSGHLLNNIFNSLRAKFFGGNINIYLHLMSLLHIDMT